MSHLLLSNIFPTTSPDKLKSEVEQKTCFSLDRCELNIFETHKQVNNVHLQFDGFTITSMLRGKKVLHENDIQVQKHYLPGETYLIDNMTEMIIDFPDADMSNPTQCTALVIENSYLENQINYINEMFPRDREMGQSWQMNLNKLWLQNDENIALLSNKIIKLFTSNDPLKEILIDIKLKELVLSIMRLHNYSQVQEAETPKSNERFKAVLDFIRRNITNEIQTSELSKIACMSKSVFYRTFLNEFGVPPNQLILNEKIKYAKALLTNENILIKEVCYALGFSDPNYFSRAFKKVEGISPVAYLTSVKNQH